MRLKRRIVCFVLISFFPTLVAIFLLFSLNNDLKNETIVSKNVSLAQTLQLLLSSKQVFKDFSLEEKALKLLSRLEFRSQEELNSSEWLLADSWVNVRHVIPENSSQLWRIEKALRETKVLLSDVYGKGSQLKVMLSLAGGQQVLFKPKRYSREEIIVGNVAGFDRHNAEIIAFQLSRLLDFRSAPIVVSRTLLFEEELRRVASRELLNTFSNESCFYGKCFYCNQFDSVCASRDGRLEGALILMLPSRYKLQRIRNPWQQSYREGVLPIWQKDSDFCSKVRKRVNFSRLLDLMDVSLFDFLIGNSDRHHYEVFAFASNSKILLLDNGKSFGEPKVDFTALLPLAQCNCQLRNTTVSRLRLLHSFGLSRALKRLLKSDSLLSVAHWKTIDERISFVLILLKECNKKRKIF